MQEVRVMGVRVPPEKIEEEGGPVLKKSEALGEILGEGPTVRSYELRIIS